MVMDNTNTDTIQKDVDTFKQWKEELKKYWDGIDKNQEMYEFYKREHSETQSQVALNTPFSIVESMVAKANDVGVNIMVEAYGEKNLLDLNEWVSAVLRQAIADPDVAKLKGTFRKQREKFLREYLVKGNAIATVEWCQSKVNGKIVADNPFVRMRDYKSVIFNPAMTLADSDIYYIESHVKLSDLKKDEYNKKTSVGKYKNLDKLKKLALAKQIEAEEGNYLSDGKKVSKKVEPIRIIEKYDGAKYKVIADDSVIIYEKNDAFKVGGHNIITAMNYTIGNRPYAYGEIDAIYKTVQAQDTVVNQSIDMINRFLRPRVLVDEASGVDLDQIVDIIENGGAMYGKPDMVGEIQSQIPPNQAFTSVETLQQAIERAARYSPYAVGLQSQVTDKTEGTKGGIQSLQVAAEPNFQIKLDAMEESFMQPVAMLFLKMIANYMGKDDIRYGLLLGKTSDWVSANKAVLTGKPTISDLVQIGYLSEEDAKGYTTMLDENGQEVPIPGADKALIFDIDWIVKVKLDNKSKIDKNLETEKKISWVQFSTELGVQFSPEKTATLIGREQGIDDPEDLYMSDDEKQESNKQNQNSVMVQEELKSKNIKEQAEQQRETDLQKIKLEQEYKLIQTDKELNNKLEIEKIKSITKARTDERNKRQVERQPVQNKTAPVKGSRVL